MVDEDGCVWLVDFDRAEAAASQALLDRDLATQLAYEGKAKVLEYFGRRV